MHRTFVTYASKMSQSQDNRIKHTYYVRFVIGGITQTRAFNDPYTAQAFRLSMLGNPNIQSVSRIYTH